MNFPTVRMPQQNLRPGRQTVVSDPSKLSYFAQANGARHGVQHAAGALSGFRDVTMPAVTDPTLKTGTDIATIAGSFLSNLLGPKTNVNVGAVPLTPPADTTILGLPPALVAVAGIAVAGFVGYKVYKGMKK